MDQASNVMPELLAKASFLVMDKQFPSLHQSQPIFPKLACGTGSHDEAGESNDDEVRRQNADRAQSGYYGRPG
jgi:hypothetical protein